MSHLRHSKFIFSFLGGVIFNLCVYGFVLPEGDGERFTSERVLPDPDYGEFVWLFIGLFFRVGIFIVSTSLMLYVAKIAKDVLFSFDWASRKKLPRERRPHDPAIFLLKIADYLPEKQRKILHQEASDLRREYEQAVLFGKTGRARNINILYHFGIGWSVLIWILDRVKEVIKISK